MKKKNANNKKKIEPYPNKGLIKGALRRIMSRSPVVRAVREKAVHPTQKGKRGGKQYICSSCKGVFPGNHIQVDHKKMVIGIKESLEDMSYDLLVKRIFCKPSNLQVLCLSCHSKKSKEENKKRREFKKQNGNKV